MSIRREIEVTRKGLPRPIDVTFGTNMLPLEFVITDFELPDGATVEAYAIGVSKKLVKQPCELSGNVISFAPEIGLFEEGKNVLQLAASCDGKDLFTFYMPVNCQKTMFYEGAQDLEEDPAFLGMVMQMKQDVGELSEQIAHYITPEMFGAKGDGVTDDSSAIQQAINNAKSSDVVYLGKNTYKITTPLLFTTSYAQFKCDGTILYNGTESAIVVKKNWMSIYVDGIEAPNGSAIQLLADANSIQTNRITVNSINCGKYGIHLKNMLGGTYYVSYNKFWCWFINAGEKGVYIEANCDGICENWFWLGGITIAKTGADIQGSADTDWSGAWSNRFFSGSFEGLADDGCAIRLTNTWSNTFANFRCEENYGKNSIVYSGKCSNNEVGLSVVALGMIDISALTSGGENILRGKICTGTDVNTGYSGGTEANISKSHGITYNPIYANVYMTMSDSTFSDKVIKQCDAENSGAIVIPTTIEPDYSTNGKTYTLGSLYSEYGSMAKGFPLVFAFYTATNGKILLKDSRGNTILDNTDGKYGGKVVSVRWNGYEKARKQALWDVQVLGETFATKEYVQNYAQPIGEYLTSYTETDPTVPSWAKASTKPAYTASEVGADASGTAESKVTAHNTSETSHNDIRLLIEGLTTRLNALADSDDTTLDQMSEVVAYIKSNKSLIDSITTSKVNVSDIIDNLTTSVSNKPLSAKQGVALKALIDAIVVPTKTSQLTNDSKFLTSVPSEYVTETELTNKEYAVKSSAETWTFTLSNGSTVTKKVVLA